jgi:Right handed beta helix region/F5/8 type C domain
MKSIFSTTASEQLFSLLVLMLLGLTACQTVAPTSDELDSETVQLILYAAPNGAGADCTATRPCTLAQARIKVRALNDTMTGHIVVRLKAGTYTLSNTFALNAADSGSNGYYVIYQGEPNATVNISGGQQLTNWTNAGNGIYKTNVGSLRFRSLFVNGTPALRSREPDDGYYRLKNWNLANKTLAINPPEISRWARLNQVEMVIQKHWNQDRLRLQDYRVVNLGSSINVAAGAVSYTSSSYDGNTVSSKGNDDNITTLYASSANDGGPYWQVDLGVAYPLKRLELVTRQDGDYEWSRRNFEVWASNNADMSLGHVVLGRQGNTALPYKATFSSNVTDTTPYRYVAVISTSGGLAFAELRAFKATTGNEQSALVTPQSPERERSFGLSYPPKEPNQVYHFENALEFLDTPGEFYLNTDTNEVFYKPRAGENLASAQVIAPRLEALVSIDGAKYLRFERIVFEHADWLKPSGEGFVGIQASAFNGGYLAAGVTVKNARSIHFVRSTFQDMGASGLNVYSNVQTALVLGCRFEDLGGQGIAFDAAVDMGSSGTAVAANVKQSSIKNNYITRIGQQYPGSVGIFTGFTEAISIEHNALWDLPYTAISAGWGWNQNETRAKRNIIRYNHIWNVVNEHDDGGGIYTLSNQVGTLIAENYIHDLKVSPWAGSYPIVAVYLDEGSSNITVKDNVL